MLRGCLGRGIRARRRSGRRVSYFPISPILLLLNAMVEWIANMCWFFAVMKELEEESLLFQSRKRRRALRDAAAALEEAERVREQQAREAAEKEAKNKDRTATEGSSGSEPVVKAVSFRGAKFY